MTTDIQRRQMLAAGTGLLLATDWAWPNNRKPVAKRMTLGFTTYGMRQLKLERALRAIAEIGFDAVEIESGVGQPSQRLVHRYSGYLPVTQVMRRIVT